MKVSTLVRLFAMLLFVMGLSIPSFAAPPMKISTQFDQFTSFGSLKTYAWNPSFKEDTSTFSPEIIGALGNVVDTEIQRNGYAKNTAGTPDFYVYYWLTKKAATEEVQMFSGKGEYTTIPTSYTAGTFVLDFSDPKTGRTMWRGWVQAEMKEDLPMPKRKERATEALSKLLAKFPPK